MAGKPLRLLVVDDSIVFRQLVSEVVAGTPGIELVGKACNGKDALEKIPILEPDVLTLDVEMPKLDGLQVLRELREQFPGVGAIMLSARTQKGAQVTMEALELGAFDFVAKPTGSWGENQAELREALHAKLQAFAASRDAALGAGTARPGSSPRPTVMARPAEQPEVVVIATSTGGPAALATVLKALPGDLPVGILVVQHMPPGFTESLAGTLDSKSALTVKEAEDGESVRAATVLVAPGGRHMMVRSEVGNGGAVSITDEPPENRCRPAADYLFRSVAKVYGGRVLAVVMTGMGSDGLTGARLLKRKGARVIGQEASSCVVYGMPRAIIEAGLADEVTPLDAIATRIEAAVTDSRGKRSVDESRSRRNESDLQPRP